MDVKVYKSPGKNSSPTTSKVKPAKAAKVVKKKDKTKKEKKAERKEKKELAIASGGELPRTSGGLHKMMILSPALAGLLDVEETSRSQVKKSHFFCNVYEFD